MNFVVSTKSLSKNYSGKTVLDDITLNIPKGRVFTLLGPNGSGKTTFLKILTGLVLPSNGEGFCLGLNIVTSGREIRKKTCLVSEEPRLYDFLSVEEMVRFCRELYPRWNNRFMEEHLKRFNIPVTEKIKNLSHGTRKQLALLIALAPEPELLLLDEPASGFDPLFRRRFLNTALEKTIGEGKTVVIASHQLGEIERVADHIAFLNRGRVIAQKSLQEIKDNMKQIRIVFQSDPPASLFSMEGIFGVTRRGNTFLIQVDKNFEAVRQACAGFSYFSMEINNLNLEDIYFYLLDNEKMGQNKIKGDKEKNAQPQSL